MWTLLMDGTLLLETHVVLGYLVHRGEFHAIVSVTHLLASVLFLRRLIRDYVSYLSEDSARQTLPSMEVGVFLRRLS